MTTTEPRVAAHASPAGYDDEPTAVLELEPAASVVAVRGGPRTSTGTHLPTPGAGAVGPRRRVNSAPPGDRANLAGAFVAAVAVAMLLFGLVAPLSGILGEIVVGYLAFLGAYAVLTSVSANATLVRDRLMTVVVSSLAVVLFSVLLLVIGFVLVKGRQALFHVNFFTSDQSRTGPLSPLTSGGVLHAVVGTLWMIGIALVITVPLGLMCAVFLAVVKGRGSRFVRTVVEAMTALPSVVAGLFIFATWILALGQGRSGLAAAFALSVMMLPIIIRAADVVLRLVPGTLVEASEALGAPRWRTVWHVVLPTSRSGLTTAVILGTARGIGETSPVLLTAGFTTYMNTNPLEGPMVSLPLAVFQFVRSPQPTMIARGFATGALLMLIVLVLFVTARIIGGRGPGQLSAGQRRRLVHRSAADARRFDELDASRAATTVPGDRTDTDPATDPPADDPMGLFR